jgi:hypothetical protein
MLRQGFAWVYDRYITEASTEVQETYRKAQEEANVDFLVSCRVVPLWFVAYLVETPEAPLARARPSANVGRQGLTSRKSLSAHPEFEISVGRLPSVKPARTASSQSSCFFAHFMRPPESVFSHKGDQHA